jgi:transketolase
MEAKPATEPKTKDLDELCVNTIRFLSVDAVQKANSGHPGLPLGAAPVGYVLWTRHLKHNPRNPRWFDRDRFVLSAGHGSMLLYSLLYLTGYEAVSLEQIKNFRQWGSLTPGHPESHLTPGVEVTTGPLGQGFANGVGMAIAEAYLAARYNHPGLEIIDHYTYGIVSDGDLMEGVVAEAASLAGHLKLGKLIYLYDANQISLAAATNLTFSEDVPARFEAYGWQTLTVDDGNDLAAIDRAIQEARQDTERPSLILVRSHIGYGSPNKQDSYEAHGAPLGEEEVRLTKENLGWPVEPAFYLPERALANFRRAVDAGQQLESAWQAKLDDYRREHPELAAELDMVMQGRLPDGWDNDIPVFPGNSQAVATRSASGKVLNAIAPYLPTLIGGSADLNPSTKTELTGMGDFEHPSRAEGDTQGSAGGGWSHAGRNIHFGVREHAMGSILNGMAAHGGMHPFGGTFLVFSDYMRPAIRLAAIAGLPVIYVFTHDSIGVGEDGPTHEPVEHVLALRAIPNLAVIRPADANETAEAWRIAVERRDGPVALVLSRQKLPVLDPDEYPQIAEGVRAGAYVLAQAPGEADPEIILAATGSEVSLALAARAALKEKGVMARVVSMPSWELFERQEQGYKQAVIPPHVPVLAVEAGVTLGWRTYLGHGAEVVGVDRFGASAPGGRVLQEYGFNIENVVERALQMVGSES